MGCGRIGREPSYVNNWGLRQLTRFEWILRPATLLLVSVLASFAVWMIPGQSELLRGFISRSQVSFLGVIILIGWYCACFVIIWQCVKLGERTRSLPQLERFETSPRLELRFYWFLSIAATIGVVFSVVMIANEVSLWQLIVTRNVNVAAAALPHGTGLSTLRYATAIAAPIGVLLWQRKRAPLWLAMWNILLLLASVTLASRLSLIVAIIVYLFLFIRTVHNVRVKAWVMVVAVVGLGLVLTVLNYVRTAGTYEEYGVDNPIAMNFFQIAAYLGAPAQVSIGVATAIGEGSFAVSGGPISSLHAILPTFLDFKKLPFGDGTVSGRYDNLVSVAENFNANSAFADTYARYGWWGLFYILCALAIAGFVFGVFARYKSVAAAVSAVLLYGFADFWRGFLFNQGVLLFLVLVSIAGLFFALYWPRVERIFRSVGRGRQGASSSAFSK